MIPLGILVIFIPGDVTGTNVTLWTVQPFLDWSLAHGIAFIVADWTDAHDFQVESDAELAGIGGTTGPVEESAVPAGVKAMLMLGEATTKNTPPNIVANLKR